MVGAAVEKITPEPGTPMAGYYHERAADGVLDDLYAKAIVLEAEGVRAALVSLDLISTSRSFVEAARAEIERDTGIPKGSVMISATHAHTGPILSDTSSRYDALGGKNPKSLSYMRELPSKIAAVVKAASGREISARVSSAVGSCPVGFNRRFHMRDGTVGWNPGVKNPDIIKPAGPTDPELPFVYFEGADPGKRPIATYVSYSVHLDNTGGTKFSADVPFVVAECLSWWRGKEHVTAYGSGACGDINQINVRWEHAQQGPEVARRLGVVLSGEILEQWPKLKPVDSDRLQVRSEILRLPLAEVASEDIARAEAALKRGLSDGTRANFMEMVQTYRALDVAERKGQPLEAEVQVITLGSRLAWVALPGEVFVQLGLDLKLDSPFAQTMPVELANGSVGYIPNRRAYPQGNYEVLSARCAEGSGELIVQAALRMLRAMHLEASKNL